jgi:hypothetical protein
MRVIHRLVGYDRQTDRIKIQFDIPDDRMAETKKIAKVPLDDPDAAWSYHLTEARTRQVAKLIGVDVAMKEAEFFLEAFSVA